MSAYFKIIVGFVLDSESTGITFKQVRWHAQKHTNTATTFFLAEVRKLFRMPLSLVINKFIGIEEDSYLTPPNSELFSI